MFCEKIKVLKRVEKQPQPLVNISHDMINNSLKIKSVLTHEIFLLWFWANIEISRDTQSVYIV